MPTPVINRPGQNGVSPYIAINDGVEVATTNQTLQLLKTFGPFKGGCLGPNGVFDFDLFVQYVDNLDAKEVQLRLVGVGGTWTFAQGGPSTSLTMRALYQFCNKGAENAQIAFPSSTQGINVSSSAPLIGAIDTSQDFTIELYGAAYIAPDVTTIHHVKGVISPG